jgi:uncharacterized protein
MAERMSETTRNNHVAGLTTKLCVSGAVDMSSVTDGLARLMMLGAKCPGFWSAEIVPPSANRGEWTLVERFSTSEQASNWMQSRIRRELLEKLRSVAPGRILSWEDILDDPGTPGTVATAIVTYVKPGMEEAYWDWETRIQTAQARFPGYRGTYVQPPRPENPGQWTTLLRFDTPESLESWLVSDTRKALLAEIDRLVNDIRFQDMSSSFPGWFPVDGSGRRPPIWKTACLVLIGMLPAVIAQKALLVPLLLELKIDTNSALVYALTTAVSIAVVSWISMPVLVKFFRWWLLPEPIAVFKTNLVGGVVCIAILLAQLALFWSL